MPDNKISIRNCFLFDEYNNITQNKYILEIIKSRLFYLSPQGLTLEQIYEYFVSEVNIEFTYDEITDAINLEKGNTIDENGNLFSLTSVGFSEVISARNDNKLSLFIQKFISENNITTFDYETIRDLFLHFIYEKFNQNFNSINQIINSHAEFDGKSRIYTNEEKTIINSFLSWDYPGKAKCIYQVINKAYDYCCITTNNDDNCFIDLDEWTFFLDTNIFFRLAGFNYNSGRDLLQRFIKLGRKFNLKFKYTNFTKDEIYKAIDRQINYIKDICDEYSLISPEQFKNYIPSDLSIEFYRIFYKWSYRNNNIINYSIFTAHIYEIMNNILQDFEEDNDGLSYYSDNRGYNTQSLNDSIHTDIPQKPINAIKTDLNNILYINDKNKQNKDMKYCLITVDTGVINWCNKSFVGKKIAELPMVWLTILLKFKGRASSKDYEAFCNFIAMPIFVQNNTKIEERLEILACAQAVINDADLKDKALRELNIHYSKYNKYDKPEKKVEAAIDNLYKQGLEENEKYYKEKLDELIQKNNSEFSRLKDAYAELIKKLDDNDDNNIIRLDTILNQAKNKASSKIALYIIIFIISILLFISAVIIVPIKISKETTDIKQSYVIIIEGIIALLSFIIETILYNSCFLGFNRNKIIGRTIIKLGIKANLELETLNRFCAENRFE